MADPPPVMRQMNANEERANNDVHVLHLRDDSPEPVHHNNILHSTTDSKLNPMALYPQPEPQLYKSFDWYACNKQGCVRVCLSAYVTILNSLYIRVCMVEKTDGTTCWSAWNFEPDI